MKTGPRVLLLAMVLLLGAMATNGWAAACKIEDFGRTVDESGAALRAFNLEATPKLREKMAALAAKNAWPDTEAEQKLQEFLQDDRIAGFDTTANELLSQIDTLSQAPETAGQPDCAKRDQLEATGVELLAVMKAKSAYTLAKIDAQLGATLAPSPADVPSAKESDQQPAELKKAAPKTAETAVVAPPSLPVPKDSADKPKAKPEPQTEPKSKPEPKVAKKQPEPRDDAYALKKNNSDSSSWSTETKPAPDKDTVLDPLPPAADISELPYPPPLTSLEPEEGYSIDEIRDATRGFFGTISTNLASVIEYAFTTFGKPTGYVLGKEGGGAFLAGVRYGSGRLYLRRGESRTVYWHGPSIGSDIGADGSRTMFLIYSLKEPEGLFRQFTGIDGSAYLVGGVGITFLKGGDVVMAPIRSGLGLRVGANLGYIRFTPQPTWNPF